MNNYEYDVLCPFLLNHYPVCFPCCDDPTIMQWIEKGR